MIALAASTSVVGKTSVFTELTEFSFCHGGPLRTVTAMTDDDGEV
jgi:hypothetical protein